MQSIIFFSYSRHDSDFAKLGKDLRTAGISIWLDQLDIEPGERWDVAIEQGLAACSRILVILSPASVASNNVMDEVSYALEEGKPVIPVLHGECDIPFRLRRVQYTDFRADYQVAFDSLLRYLNAAAAPASDTQQARSAGDAVPSPSDRLVGHTPAGSGQMGTHGRAEGRSKLIFGAAGLLLVGIGSCWIARANLLSNSSSTSDLQKSADD